MLTSPGTGERPHIPVPDDLVELGRVVSAYGVKGWVKIQPHSSQADVLLKAKTWWLKAPIPPGGSGASSRPVKADVEAVRPHSGSIVAQLDFVPDRNVAETLKGHTVWVSRAQFPAADADEYYWVDLIGCELWGDHEGRSVLLGKVTEVLDNGAHAILRVQRLLVDANGEPAPMLDDKGRPVEDLIPFVSAHVHTVDLEAKRLESNWPAEF